jgi:hypothetical protein
MIGIKRLKFGSRIICCKFLLFGENQDIDQAARRQFALAEGNAFQPAYLADSVLGGL